MRADFDTLVLAAAKGDAGAYGSLVDQTSALVSSITLAIVGDLELSRDVAQDVFLSVWRDLRNLRNPASFLPWLRQIARNRAKIALRTTSRRRRLGVTGVLDELLPVVTDARPSIADEMIADEQSRAVAEALSALPEEMREVVTLFYREGQSVAQVASLLELSEAAVRKRLSRARQILRASLLDQVGETLRSTTPGPNFGAIVVAMLPVSGPPGALATIAVSKLPGASAWGLVAKLLLPLSGVLLGGAGGSLGVLFGARKLHKEAIDDQERRGLKQYTAVSVVAVLFFAAIFPILWNWTHSRWCAVAWFLAFLSTLASLMHVWLPRIVKRRMLIEMEQNPEFAIKRRSRERRQAILGWTLGITFGSLGLIIGLWVAR